MEYALLILGLLLILAGILGSILPALPGPPLSWLGLLCIYFVPGIPTDYTTIITTLIMVIAVAVLDYIIPAQGTKRFGGTKYGIWGTNVGLLAGLFLPPFGFIIGPFLGAMIGELIYDPKNVNRALKAAMGAFMGFLASTFIKILICLILLGLYIVKIWQYKDIWF